MQLCCTKKLLDELEIAPQNGAEGNDIFCWSGHLITINRKKTIVVINDKNRFGFILYGLKKSDFKNLDRLIIEGISNSMKDEKIKDEIIKEYLLAAGDVVLTKTRGPKYVSRLNKACEITSVFEYLMDPKTIIQVIPGRRMNNDYIKVDKNSDYEHPHELLYKDLRELTGKEVYGCEAVELMIRLNLGKNTAVRRVITPADITFKQLHNVLQAAYGWKDYHLYDFNIINQKGSLILKVVSDLRDNFELPQDFKTLLDTEARLLDYAGKDYKIIYTYDFGDNWEHEIICMDTVTDYDKNYPVCLEGEGNAPPEDVGGIPGYEEFLEIIKNPGNEAYEDTLRWVRSQWYSDFDINKVNGRLKSMLRL